MAGRVERTINDKFYFVLDEVGDSSGVESEIISDNETMASSKDGREDITKSTNFMEDNDMSGSKVTGQMDTHNQDYVNEKSSQDNASYISVNNPDISCDKMNTTEVVPTFDNTGSHNSCPNTDLVNMDLDCNSDGEIDEKSDDTIGPIIKISFRDEKIKKKYKSSILKFLTQEIQSCNVIKSNENNLEIRVYRKEPEKRPDDDVLDFTLDTTPSGDSYGSRVPYYGKTSEMFLTHSEPDKTEPDKSEVSSIVCFNCSGNHALRDCPHERNEEEIMKQKIQFSRNNRSQKASRYHLDESQRFGNLVPGELSKHLRNALTLKKDQQPLFIYRMRLLGYPPAWLEEARVSHSGVAIYDTNGLPITEEGDEEGEIIPEGAKDRFDISKIIEFPGFNVPLPNHMKEEGKLHYCPSMSEEQSKRNLIEKLQPNAVTAYKKRNLCLQKSPQVEEGNSANTDRKRLSSPTIEEMEEKKRQLLMALDNEDGIMNSDSLQCNTPREKQKVKNTESNFATPENGNRNRNNMKLGTPVLKSISPYSKLPSREQFSVNVSDVINFENLPNSTGKYESMSNLILKIRDTVSGIHND